MIVGGCPPDLSDGNDNKKRNFRVTGNKTAGELSAMFREALR